MFALKFSHLIKERTQGEVYNFYIDMRAFGKGYEEFYSRVLHEGANVIRGRSPRWSRRAGRSVTKVHC